RGQWPRSDDPGSDNDGGEPRHAAARHLDRVFKRPGHRVRGEVAGAVDAAAARHDGPGGRDRNDSTAAVRADGGELLRGTLGDRYLTRRDRYADEWVTTRVRP